jgi:hypothetical protein
MAENPDTDDQHDPVLIEVDGASVGQEVKPPRKLKPKMIVPRGFKLKEFGIILISKNTDLVGNYHSYRTHTFNANIVKEWAARNQIPHYLTMISTGSTPNDKIINKVVSVQIASNSEVISTGEEQGAASMGWLDKNADLLINVTSRIW